MAELSAPVFFIPHDEAARQRQWAALDRADEPAACRRRSDVRSGGSQRRASDQFAYEEAVRGIVNELS
ncbi:MAG: hypothetical protein QM775_04375 [Pirellulales bacterium]